MKSRRILYIAPYPSATFVVKDIELLSSRYQVVFPLHQWNRTWAIPLLLCRQCIYLIRNLRRVEAIMVMFGGYWSLLPAIFGRVFRKPVFIILGGADCVSFPSIHYGSLRKPILRMFMRYSFKYASCLVPVHGSLVYGENRYVHQHDSAIQGYLHYFPELKTEHQVIFNGFDADYLKIQAGARHKVKNAFITVASIPSYQRFVLKGIDVILYLAKELPDCTFTIVGITKAFSSTLKSIPTNVKCIEFIPFEECVRLMSEHEFHLQISLSEGFPNSLCEAMLLECIPIGSSVGGIPDIIGDTGVVIENTDMHFILNEVSKLVLLSDERRAELSHLARERIAKNFTEQRRQEQLLDLIDSYISGAYK